MTLGRTKFVAALVLGLSTAASAQEAATVGSGGSASAGGTSASTIGTAGASTDGAGGYGASVGSGGSAAAVDGKVDSRTKINANPYKVQGQSRATAQDGGTFSKSRTKTTVNGDDLSSQTRTMSHEPGQKPIIERSTSDATLGN